MAKKFVYGVLSVMLMFVLGLGTTACGGGSAEDVIKKADEAIDAGNLDEAFTTLKGFTYNLDDFGGTANMSNQFTPVFKKLYKAYEAQGNTAKAEEVVDFFKSGPCGGNSLSWDDHKADFGYADDSSSSDYERTIPAGPSSSGSYSEGSDSGYDVDIVEIEDDDDDDAPAASASSASGSNEIDALLNEYESVMNKYVSFARRAANGDMSVMTEYASLSTEISSLYNKLSAKASQMTPAQASRLSQIAAKAANAL